jgi:hypothetical protein
MSRVCGTCTLCCKLMGIRELDKPRGVWCAHCSPKSGCDIYPERPGECRDFVCAWLGDEGLGDEWKPDKSRMVLVPDQQNNRYVVYVDPAMPDIWKRAPYYDMLMRLMHTGLPLNRLVFIDVGGRVGMMLPDRLEDLGILGPKDEVALQMVKYPHTTEYKVSVRRGA